MIEEEGIYIENMEEYFNISDSIFVPKFGDEDNHVAIQVLKSEGTFSNVTFIS